jgi:betaine reductase
MDLQNQAAILESVRQHGKENLVVLLGAPNAESSAIAAETVVSGDPSYAGPLAGVQLDLPVFHILDDRVREAIPPALYEAEIGIMDAVLDKAAIVASVEAVRTRAR